MVGRVEILTLNITFLGSKETHDICLHKLTALSDNKMCNLEPTVITFD